MTKGAKKKQSNPLPLNGGRLGKGCSARRKAPKKYQHKTALVVCARDLA